LYGFEFLKAIKDESNATVTVTTRNLELDPKGKGLYSNHPGKLAVSFTITTTTSTQGFQLEPG